MTMQPVEGKTSLRPLKALRRLKDHASRETPKVYKPPVDVVSQSPAAKARDKLKAIRKSR